MVSKKLLTTYVKKQQGLCVYVYVYVFILIMTCFLHCRNSDYENLFVNPEDYPVVLQEKLVREEQSNGMRSKTF